MVEIGELMTLSSVLEKGGGSVALTPAQRNLEYSSKMTRDELVERVRSNLAPTRAQ